MQKPDNLNDEKSRIEVLKSYEILDSPSDDDYNSITFLASEIFNAPISLISLVDEERQWFKSKIGLDISETERDISFCTHAIHTSDEVYVIEDARKNAMFQNNPLVTGKPDIVFYAGAPLVDSDGYVIGTLCIIDTKERSFSTQEAQKLKILANQVMKLLDLRKKNNHLKILNNEKTILLKEIQHRVKNNLQLISSLISLQISKLSDKNLSDSFNICLNRIMAISNIHQNIYLESARERVNFKIYITDLLNSFEIAHSSVKNIQNEIEDITLGLDIAVPLGLIISEILTNTFKHAFTDSQEKHVQIVFQKKENDQLELIIKDSGVGFNTTEKWETSDSLGFEIIKTLIDQINGSITCFSTKNGTCFSIQIAARKS
jgi:two-component sensor histidine kinase